MRLRDRLGPAWFDEARLIVQGRVFEQMLEGRSIAGRVLNAGCGEGLYAPMVERFSAVTEILNLDVTPPTVARRRADRRHRDLQASLTSLPFAAATFDAAICSEVLEHIPADGKAVAELGRVMKPGALLLVSVPTPPAPKDVNHVREGYRPEQFTILLREHGFEPIAMSVCMHAWMRALYLTWLQLHRLAGRNVFPRPFLRSMAHIDRYTRWGAPWDLVAIACKR